MFFGMTDEQKMIVETTRAFVENELYPHEAEVERTGHLRMDLIRELQAKAIEAGLYAANMPALLRPETAARLRKANELVKRHGYRIQVWDAYRPPSAQLILWEASGHDDRYVANPYSKPSQHSCGTAVDVTLVTLDGFPVEMPTGFDSFTPEAAAAYRHPDPAIQKRKEILQAAMFQAGFFRLPNEWWHFTDRRFRDYPQTIALSEIESTFKR